jgi:hypothetical protein
MAVMHYAYDAGRSRSREKSLQMAGQMYIECDQRQLAGSDDWETSEAELKTLGTMLAQQLAKQINTADSTMVLDESTEKEWSAASLSTNRDAP